LVQTTTRVEQGTKQTFARHETFHLRDGWLYKGLQAVKKDGRALFATDAHHNLGVGLNMRKSLLYWIQATGLAEPDDVSRSHTTSLALTETARLIDEYDPYLEDIGTMWVLHANLASNREFATFWFWMFNDLAQRYFNDDRMVARATELIEEKME